MLRHLISTLLAFIIFASSQLKGDNLFDAFIQCSDSQNFLKALNHYDHDEYLGVIEELNHLQSHYKQFETIETGDFHRDIKESLRIPKILHFIWLGDKEFFPPSVRNLRYAMNHHPDYKIFFWTDRKRTLRRIEPKYEKRIAFKSIDEIDKVLDFDLDCKKLFYLSKNEGEKADILRYLILYYIGGVYLDHDVRVFRPFDILVDHLSFFCFCDRLYGMVERQHVKFANAMIASSKGNRIIKKTLDRMKSDWDYWTEIFNRINFSFRLRDNFHVSHNHKLYSHSVFLKTFLPLTLAIKEMALTSHEAILPPQMFIRHPAMPYNHPFAFHSIQKRWWKEK